METIKGYTDTIKEEKTISLEEYILSLPRETFGSSFEYIHQRNEDEQKLKKALGEMEKRNPSLSTIKSHSFRKTPYAFIPVNDYIDKIGVDFETNQPKYNLKGCMMKIEKGFGEANEYIIFG